MIWVNPYIVQTPSPPQNWPKGERFNFFNKGRDRKKGWDGVIGGRKKTYKTFSISLKETQTLKAY